MISKKIYFLLGLLNCGLQLNANPRFNYSTLDLYKGSISPKSYSSQMENQDHYARLGLSQSATNDEIKQAYRKLTTIMHPDKGGTQEKFTKLNDSYSTLSDPEKRFNYDQETIENKINILHEQRNSLEETAAKQFENDPDVKTILDWYNVTPHQLYENKTNNALNAKRNLASLVEKHKKNIVDTVNSIDKQIENLEKEKTHNTTWKNLLTGKEKYTDLKPKYDRKIKNIFGLDAKNLNPSTPFWAKSSYGSQQKQHHLTQDDSQPALD